MLVSKLRDGGFPVRLAPPLVGHFIRNKFDLIIKVKASKSSLLHVKLHLAVIEIFCILILNSVHDFIYFNILKMFSKKV